MNYFLWGVGIVLVSMGLRYFSVWNSKPVKWEPNEVVALLESWLQNNVDDGVWDYFESCQIANPNLEKVRIKVLEATYWDTPYIDSFGTPDQKLNEKGITLFNQLIEECGTI